MTCVVAAGIAVLDCIFRLESIPQSAEKHIADDARWVVGGCAANAAIAIARLGGEAMLMSELGDDLAGDLIAQRLDEQGIDLTLLTRRSQARSALSSVYIDARGERQIVNFRGDLTQNQNTEHNIEQNPDNNPDNKPDNNPVNSPGQSRSRLRQLLDTRGAAAVLADTRWAAGAAMALSAAAEQGLPGVLDAEPPIPTHLLQLASHVAFSRSGLLSLQLADSLSASLLAAAEKLPWVCVTDGADGVYTVHQGAIRHHPAYPINAQDTLGAGDVWHGAFTLQLARGHGEEQSIQFANAAAALKCRNTGGGDAAPDLASVQKFIQSPAALTVIGDKANPASR